MADVVAGIRVPDSKLAREATDLLRKHGTPLLLAHSLRVYLFGAIHMGAGMATNLRGTTMSIASGRVSAVMSRFRMVVLSPRGPVFPILAETPCAPSTRPLPPS
jgi:hypothetical protein